MSALTRLFHFSRTQRIRAQSAYRFSVSALKSVRHPNALLSSLVVLPVLVGGFSFGERTAEAREAAGQSLAYVAANAGFGVDAIRIEGLRDTREGDVLDYLAVTPTTSVLGFDIDAARDRVLALPWVKEASVRRVYPNQLMVEIEEHAPFARMLQRGRVHLVTVEGEEITDEITDVHAGLPLVVGEGAPGEATAFFAHLAARPHVLGSVVALERVGDRRWTLHMREDVQVHLPELEVDAALVRLEEMMRREAVLERAITVIDLRSPDQLVVQLTDAAVEAMSEEAEGLTAARGGA
ncbi:FtsQ-type POTRA domain-containing protein [Ahrensia marina]|uniref:cell division protein FtsQ/DivIB n=1 Tax=Ahrensia marina TaxID=1514904 RepID=UPI0035D112FF